MFEYDLNLIDKSFFPNKHFRRMNATFYVSSNDLQKFENLVCQLNFLLNL